MSGELEKWIALGRSLGVRDDELREWVEEQRAMERQTRAEERAARAAERQLDERVLLAEERVLALWVQAANQATAAVGPDSSSTASERFRPGSHKVMPVFDEKRDDLDAYLHRFEIVAEGLRWPKEQWATALSLSLAGEALAVFGRLSPQESNDYENVRDALLETFRYTAEGFREKFRSSTPDKKETAKQFGARLTHFFDKWVETSETPKEFTSLRDLMLREQFLLKCPPALAVFLKEGECETLDETCKRADKYLEAQGLRTMGKAEEEPVAPKSVARKPTGCMLRGEMGHRASDCRTAFTRQRQGACWSCGETGHRSVNCPKRGLESGAKNACVMGVGSGLVNYGSVSYREQPLEGRYTGCTTVPKEYLVNAVHSRNGDRRTTLRWSKGRVNGQSVEVLRDTGSNMVIVRRGLVKDSQLTGRYVVVRLADGTPRWLPEAVISIATPYLSGNVVAYCMNAPIGDLLVGNVTGTRRTERKSPEPAKYSRSGAHAVVGAVPHRSREFDCAKRSKATQICPWLHNSGAKEQLRRQQCIDKGDYRGFGSNSRQCTPVNESRARGIWAGQQAGVRRCYRERCTSGTMTGRAWYRSEKGNT
ncbi:uncharacterized protein LOC135378716 [Ornithodoros turicata]|uniref:uncharacterized protein LOC135378716 n=1 Tax=Ornithodoros turicata TaxID=34597 RepID=UPI0031387795